MPIAVITFDFDPLLRLSGDLVVRWQTVALAAVFAIVLIVVGLAARRRGLRPDDLLSIAVGAVPGAVVIGRLGYLVTHPDAFAAGPATLIDPGVGGLELAAGVVGGILTGGYVAMLLGAPLGAWAHLVGLPVLVTLGAGKLAMVLGGSGQGLPSDLSWATAYLGPGPWGSLAPELPSHPAQAYEGLATLLLTVLLAIALAAGAFRSRDGRLLLAALVGWTIVRAVVSTTWRDPLVGGPLPASGLLALAVAGGCVLALAALTLAGRRRVGSPSGPNDGEEPSWPDPASRPQF